MQRVLGGVLFVAFIFFPLFIQSQIVEFGIELEGVDCAGEILGPPGGFVRIRGFTTMTMFQDGVAGWTQSVKIRSPDGAGFCIDVATTEDFTPELKEELTGLPILKIFRDPTSFVIQNREGRCQNGDGDPHEPENGGRRGFIDSTILPIGEVAPAGVYRTVPFELSIRVPEDSEGVAMEIEFVNWLKGRGSVIGNDISFAGATRRLGSGPGVTAKLCRFRIKPAPLSLSLDLDETLISGFPGVPIRVSMDAILQTRDPLEIAGFRHSLGYVGPVTVRDVRLAETLLLALPLGAVEFQSIEFSPAGLDPDEVFIPAMPHDPTCDLEPGAPQGNGIVVDVVVTPLGGPGIVIAAGETMPTITIDLEQDEAFGSTSDEPERVHVLWRNCLRGTGDRIRTELLLPDGRLRNVPTTDAFLTLVAGALVTFDGPDSIFGTPEIVPRGSLGVMLKSAGEIFDLIGLRFSVGHSSSVRVTETSVTSEFLDFLSDDASIGFQSIEFSPEGVDPADVLDSEDLASFDCELAVGQRHGLVAEIVLETSARSGVLVSRDTCLRVLEVVFEPSRPFESGTDHTQTDRFFFRDCHRGRCGVTRTWLVVGDSIYRPFRGDRYDVLIRNGVPFLVVDGSPGFAAPIGEIGTGHARVCLDAPAGVGEMRGVSLSLGASDNLVITDVIIDAFLQRALDEVQGAIGFSMIEHSPLGVDPDEIFISSGAPDADCDLKSGQPQGNGLVAQFLFDTPGDTGLFLLLGRSLSLLGVSFEHDHPLTPADGRSQPAHLRWRDCLRGSGEPIKNSVLLRSRAVTPPRRDYDFEFFTGFPGFSISGGDLIPVLRDVPGRSQAGLEISSPAGATGFTAFQASLGYSETIVVTDVRLGGDLFGTIDDGRSIAFQFMRFSLDDVDPTDIVDAADSLDPECELTPGEPQGNGIVAWIVLEVPEGGALPLSDWPFELLRIEYEQANSLDSSGVDLESGAFFWENCHRGSGRTIKSSVTLDGEVFPPLFQEGHEVEFVDKVFGEYGFELEDGCGTEVFGVAGSIA